MAKPRHRRSVWIGLVFTILLVVVGFLIMRREKAGNASAAQDQPQTPTIKVSTARRGDIGVYVEALGTVTPVSTVNVYTQVSGTVMAVHYTEGQMIRKGDELIDIDPRLYEAQLQEAQGTLEHDQGLLAQAQIDLARYQDATTQNAISRQTFEDQEQTVVQYKGTVKNDLGQVQYAQVQLSYCHLVSPIAGRVGLRLVDPGNTVFSGSSNALVVITQLQPITVVFNVAEDYLGQLHDQIQNRGDLPVDAFDRAQQRKIASGKLLTLDNQIDTTTGTVRFRGEFANADLNLFPNQFVNVRLLANTLKGATLIPGAAVQRNGVDAFVYHVSDGIAKVQSIKELTADGDLSAVEGISPGDAVAITGFDKLQDNTKVNVQASATTQGGDSAGPSSRPSGPSSQAAGAGEEAKRDGGTP